MTAPPQPSRLPAVVDAVVAVGAQMASADEVDLVIYGPTAKGATKGKRTLAVFVGSPGAQSRLDLMPGSVDSYTETVDVNCNVVSWSGQGTVRQHNLAVYGILDALRLALFSDPTLGGVCEYATLGQAHTPFPMSDVGGVSVELAFAVRAVSYI